VDGRYLAWDLKTSKKDPTLLLYLHTFQLAAYCVGASIHLGVRVDPGGLILARRYKQDGTGPVFWHYPWTFDDCAAILEPVRHQVAAIRSGRVHHNPNENCGYCPARSPDVCLPKLKRLQLPILSHPAVEALKLYPGMAANTEHLASWENLKDKILAKS
jgi:hypothetical protein